MGKCVHAPSLVPDSFKPTSTFIHILPLLQYEILGELEMCFLVEAGMQTEKVGINQRNGLQG